MLLSEEVWEQPAGGAGTELPQTGWRAGWGKQRRQWEEIDLQANTNVHVWSFIQGYEGPDARARLCTYRNVRRRLRKNNTRTLQIIRKAFTKHLN